MKSIRQRGCGVTWGRGANPHVPECLGVVLPPPERAEGVDPGLAGRTALAERDVSGGVVQVNRRSSGVGPGIDAAGMPGGHRIADGLRNLVAVDRWRVGQHDRLDSDGDVAAAQPVPNGLRGHGADPIDPADRIRIRAGQSGIGEMHVQPDPRRATAAVTLPQPRRPRRARPIPVLLGVRLVVTLSSVGIR